VDKLNEKNIEAPQESSADGFKWNWFSQNKGSGVIQFVMEMEGESWLDAVKELLGISHDEMPVVPKPRDIETKGKMVLPEKNDTYKHLFAYLIKSRGIDQDVVTELVDKKLIYEDSRRSCVFESPIDLMSYLSLLKGWYAINDFNHHLIALGGVTDKALQTFFNDHGNVDTIILCELMTKHGMMLMYN